MNKTHTAHIYFKLIHNKLIISQFECIYYRDNHTQTTQTQNKHKHQIQTQTHTTHTQHKQTTNTHRQPHTKHKHPHSTPINNIGTTNRQCTHHTPHT